MSFEKGCQNKARFSDRKTARKARSHHPGGNPVSIYRCEFCGFLHIGRMPRVVRNGEVDKDDWTAQWAPAGGEA